MGFWSEKRRRRALNSILVILLGCIIYSGFAYPLHFGDGMWPFNRDWFMFSSDDGYDFELQAEGQFKDGSTSILDVKPLFRFVIGTGNRFQEVPRDHESMTKLAKYLCEKYPIQEVSIRDLVWLRGPGQRKLLQEIPPSQVRTTNWVKHQPCG